jgi:hypothetical protein
MTRLAFAFVLALCSLGCTTSEGPRPEDVPRRQLLVPGAVPLMRVTFEADEGGYRVVDTVRAVGAPTLAIDQNRDVLITAYDATDQIVGSVSVSNPREAHTVGTDNPELWTLPRGTVTVRLPKPDEITSVEVTVRRGPNANYRERLRVRLGTGSP